MTAQSPDLISELLRGMRLSGVKYRRIEASAPFGVAFHQAPGKAQFHFVSHGSALLRMESGATFTLNGGDALLSRTATPMPCSLTSTPALPRSVHSPASLSAVRSVRSPVSRVRKARTPSSSVDAWILNWAGCSR